MDMKLKYHQRLESLKRYMYKCVCVCVCAHVRTVCVFVFRYFTDNGLTLPPVIKPLIDVDFATMATDSLMEYLQPLITVSHN